MAEGWAFVGTGDLDAGRNALRSWVDAGDHWIIVPAARHYGFVEELCRRFYSTVQRAEDAPKLLQVRLPGFDQPVRLAALPKARLSREEFDAVGCEVGLSRGWTRGGQNIVILYPPSEGARIGAALRAWAE
jgi:hypothetical protein